MRRIQATAIAATTAATLSVLCAPAATAHPKATNGLIAFGGITTHAGFDADIYTIRPDGAELTQLPSGPGADLCPDWDRDGERIVFCSNRTGAWEIFTMDADGSDQRQVTSLDGFAVFPDFSPSGKRIVFSGSAAGDDPEDDDLFVIDDDGRHLKRITDTDEHNEQLPVWAPHGNRIAFLDLTMADDGSEQWQVHTIKSNGKGRRQLTHDATWKDQTVEWSPDGRTIAYVGDADIWLVDHDGGTPRRILTTDAEEFGLSWSPDGTRLAFLRIHDDGRRGLYSIAIDGSDEQLVLLTDDGPNPAVPAWGPASRSKKG